MAGNFRGYGEQLNYTNAGSAIASGALVIVGAMVGVALSAIPTNATGALRVCGIFNFAKLSTDAVAQGVNIYWDSTNSRMTLSSSGNTLAGKAAYAAGNGATTVDVLLNGLC